MSTTVDALALAAHRDDIEITGEDWTYKGGLAPTYANMA
jgi:hypothetical protein